jgi:hypothetical protein
MRQLDGGSAGRGGLMLGVAWLLVAPLALAVAAGKPPRLPETRSWTGRSVLLTPHGTFHRFYMSTVDGQPSLVRVESTDDGVTWSEPRVMTHMPDGGFGGCSAVLTPDGEIQLFITKGRRINDGTKPAVDRFIDLWHMRSSNGQTKWTEPRMVFEGYIGSISNSIQLESGRIINPFGSWIPGSVSGPPTGNQFVTVISSNDNGETFNQSDAKLVSPCYPDYNGANVGACEPAIVQLADGRVWMVMRTQAGFLYESFSDDGVTWSDAKPSRFHASTGPPDVVRLPDDRIALFWNSAEMPPRVDGRGVYGGRDVLHAAIADPELKTWHGFREIYRDPTRHQIPPKRGDRGTAYPDAIVTRDGNVAVMSGQGGLRQLILVDPHWLYETRASTHFSDGLEQWTVFKSFGPASGWWRDRAQGPVLIDHPDKPGRKALHVRKPDENDPDGAVWNFPNGRAGTLSLRFRINDGCRGASVALNDRFFDPSDDAGEKLAIFQLPFDDVEPDKWHTLELAWDIDAERCTMRLNGQQTATLTQRNETPNGISYLRLRSTADTIDAGWLIESIDVQVNN